MMTIEEAHLRLGHLDELWCHHINEFHQVNLHFLRGHCAASRNLLWAMTEDIMPVYRERDRLWGELWKHFWTGSNYIGEYELEPLDVLDCWFGDEIGPLRQRLAAIEIAELLDA